MPNLELVTIEELFEEVKRRYTDVLLLASRSRPDRDGNQHVFMHDGNPFTLLGMVMQAQSMIQDFLDDESKDDEDP